MTEKTDARIECNCGTRPDCNAETRPDCRIPLFLDLRDRLVVICGGGSVAERKARFFCGRSKVLVVASRFSPGLLELGRAGLAGLIKADLLIDPEQYLLGAFIVVPATNETHLNRHLESLARGSGALVNRVDEISGLEDLGEVVVPSVVRNDGIAVAISTGVPALTRHLRLEIEEWLGDRYPPMARLLQDIRSALKTSVGDQRMRRTILASVVEDCEVWSLLPVSYEKAYKRACEVVEKGKGEG
jgi:siroheme synthase-like protein